MTLCLGFQDAKKKHQTNERCFFPIIFYVIFGFFASIMRSDPISKKDVCSCLYDAFVDLRLGPQVPSTGVLHLVF